MDTYDAVVVGGGPAGLQAALTLGRMHRSTLLLDSGEYRNAPVEHLQNFLTHDGRAPADFRAAARADLAAYSSVTVREARAGSATEEDGLFRVALEDGTSISGRALLLATGVRDTLPDKPGLAELFGTVAAHCPFCHGHELAGTHVAVLGNGPHAARLPLLLAPIADRVTVLADGGPIDPAAGDLLARAGVTVRPDPVTGFRRSDGGATVSFASGPDEEVGGVFVATTFAQSAPLAEQLGLELLPSGCVRVDELGRTSRPGVYAAGDLAHLAALPMPMPSVLTSAAAGLVAASSAVQALVVEDWGLVVAG
ncbi:NAD(P)/FAD-dependent oxidoreductase [Nocardioides dongkuii]|uniref:NAD(P)/FAD-dependent oxidoreductase n=1 Tax=Nocardioides dongkuii TaxID=2760089 RepID=UPI0018788712|nr:NAD(P)/FAD-dependent oxidoreductase [Nocardioides dongkuii]